jgi:hypothetical protein
VERKFIHEFAFGYLSSFTAMVAAQQLTSDAKINSAESNFQMSYYFICARPSFYFDGIKYDTLQANWVQNKVKKVNSLEYNWILEDDAIDKM